MTNAKTTTSADEGTADKTNRHWMKVTHFLSLSAWERVTYVSKIYRNAMPKVFGVVLLAFGLGVWLNYSWQFKEGNVILMLLTMMVWAFLTFHPKPLIMILTFGALKGLPNAEIEKIIKKFELPDFKLEEVLKAADKQFEGYLRVTAHIALFWTAAFAVLALFQLENGWAAYAVLAFLAGTGLWSMVYKAPAKVYRWMTSAILTFGLVTTVIAAYRYTHPQDKTADRIERALMVAHDQKVDQEIEPLLAKAESGQPLTFKEAERLEKAQLEREDRGAVGTVENTVQDGITTAKGIFDGREVKKAVAVNDFQPQLICGLRRGDRQVSIPYQQIHLGEGDYGLSDAVMLNGMPVETARYKGESTAITRVNQTGCVKLSFNYTEAVRAMPIQPQQLQLIFR